jgi:Kdo2-lipid IVA lauroyltransferase/acyltransferase
MMDLLNFFFFYLFSMLVGFLPFPLLYKFSDFLAFILRKVIKYRRAVIVKNLVSTFPGLSKNELNPIINKCYLNLSDIILEGIKAFTISRKQVLARHRILNPEILHPYLEAGKGVICVTGHYGNWEWGALSPGLYLEDKIVAFYKPIQNKWIDNFVRKTRARYNTVLAPIRETTKTFEKNKGLPVVYIMAADQSPSNREMAYWVNFLGRETAFLHGPEKHARINNYPVFYVAIRRVKRGYYELKLLNLAEDPSSLPNGRITRLYAEQLEILINEDPSNWLWSHKRWKLTR